MHSYIEYGIIFTSFCFWMYIDNVKIFNKERRIINSALFHALISGIGHSIGIICEPRIVFDNHVIVNNISDLYYICPLISFGYGFYDLYIGIKSYQIDYIIHGLIFVSNFAYYYLNNMFVCAHYIMITEISSIFLNLRCYKKRWIDLSFIASFFIIRLVVFPMSVGIYLLDPENTEKTVAVAGLVTISSLNIYWFYCIVKKALKQIKQETPSNHSE